MHVALLNAPFWRFDLAYIGEILPERRGINELVLQTVASTFQGR